MTGVYRPPDSDASTDAKLQNNLFQEGILCAWRFNISMLNYLALNHKLIQGFLQVTVPQIGISDHFPVCLVRKVNSGLPKVKGHLTIKYRCFKNFDSIKFQKVSWQQLEIIDTDPYTALDTFESSLARW